MNLLLIREALEASWGKDTTYCPEKWSKKNPALGQCAVTALVIKEYFPYPSVCSIYEGTVTFFLRKEKFETRHFWNVMGNGVHLDLTWKQFPNGAKVTNISYVDYERELNKNVWFKERYDILKKRVEEYIFNKEIGPYSNLVIIPREGMKVCLKKVFRYNLVSTNTTSLAEDELHDTNVLCRIETVKNGKVWTDQGWEISDLIRSALVYKKPNKTK